MADQLADVLNRINADPQAASPVAMGNPSLKRTLLGSTWLRNTADYVGDTDLGALAQAFMRVNPITMPFELGKDAAQGTLADTMRLRAGQLSQVPTDVVAGVTALPGLAGMASKALGGPEFGQGSLDASNDVRDFGKQYGEAIAGRTLPEDMLRGTPEEMASNWVRQLASAIIPVPTKVAAPILGLQKFTQGVDGVDKAVRIAGRTLEVLTPLAVAPTPKSVAMNVAAAGVIAPAAEAGVAGYLKGVQDQAEGQALDAQNQALEGAVEARAIKPIQAGYSTGNDYADGLVVAGLVGAALYGGLRNDLVKRVSNGVRRAATGYDPRVPEDATNMPLTTQMAQDKLNRSAGMVESLRTAAKQSGANNANDVADHFQEMISFRSGAGINTRSQVFANEGKYLDTAITANMPFNDFATKIKMLDPAGRTELAQVLHSAQELDNRNILLRRMSAGQAGQTTIPAYNLYDKTIPELRTIVTNGMAKPQIAEIANQWKDYMNKSSQYMVMRNRFTPKEASEFLRDNPNYVPPRNEKGDFINPRDITNNQGQPRGARTFEELGDPVNLMPHYMDEVFRSTEGKAIQREWMMYMQHLAGQNVPIAKDLLGRQVPLGTEVTGKTIKWRDQYGAPKTQEINDAVVRNSLRDATNPTALQLSHGLMSGLNRLYQSGAVGPLSLAHGTMFAPSSALYGVTIGTVLKRPKGIAMGWADKLVQDATGGKLSLPGDIYTMIPDATVRAGMNIGAVLVDRGAQALHHSVVTNGFMAKILTPQLADAAATRLSDWYKKTAVYDMQQRGLMGPSTQDAIDRSLMYKAPDDMLRAPNTFKSSYRFVEDILHAISSAPAMSIMAMNKGAPEWKVNSAIRNMSGDPGRSGAFRGSKIQPQIVTGTPWGSVYLQSMARMAESLNPRDMKTFSKTALGIFNASMAPAAMATLWNSMLGPEYSQHQFFNRTTDKMASSFFIGQPGAPPDEGWEVPIDPLLRPFKWAGEGIAGTLFGIFSNEIGKHENADMKDAYDEMVKYRETGTGENTMFNSILTQTLIPPVMPAIGAVAATMGVNLRNYGDARAVPANRGAGFVEGTQPDPDEHRIFNQHMYGQVEDVMRSVGASGLTAIYHMLTGVDKDVRDPTNHGGNGKTIQEALDYQTQEWKTRFDDSTQAMGSGALFGSFRALTPSSEASASVVKQKVNTIKSISEAYTATHGQFGPGMVGNKKIGVETLLGKSPVGAPDVATEAFAQEVKGIYKQLQPTLQEIKVAYQQRQSLQGDTSVTPYMRRELMNQQGERVVDLNRRMLQDIQRFELILSMKYGRPVTFDSFNKDKSFLDQ